MSFMPLEVFQEWLDDLAGRLPTRLSLAGWLDQGEAPAVHRDPLAGG